MATADQVVVELTAKTETYAANIRGATAVTTDFQSKTERSANAVESAIAGSSDRSGAALMILQGIARRTADQFAAGAAPATILAEHIAGVAEAAEFAGGPVNLLGVAISGGMGLAISVALPLLISLGGEMLKGGQSANTYAEFTKKLNEELEKLVQASDRAIQSTEGAIQASLANARAKEVEAAAVVRTTAAKLAERQEDQKRADEQVKRLATDRDPTLGGAAGGIALGAYIAKRRTKSAESATDEALFGKSKDGFDRADDGGAVGAMDLIQNNAIAGYLRDSEARTSNTTAAIRDFNRTRDKLVEELRTFQIGKPEFDRRLDAATKLRDTTTEYTAPRVSHSSDSEAYAMAEANAKIATSTDDVHRAEAELELVRAQRRSMSPSDYQAALTRAEQNVTEAKSLDELNKYLAKTGELLSKVAQIKPEDLYGGKDGGFRDAVKDADAREKASADAQGKAITDAQKKQEDGVRTLAGLYQDLFSQGTKGLWSDFERLGEEALAKLAAKQTFSLLSSLFPSGSAIGNLLGVAGRDTGGSFSVGGNAGIDNNVLSINGRPMSRVSGSETIAIIPQQKVLSAQQGAVAPAGGGGNSVVRHEISIAPSPLFDTHVDSRVIAGVIQAAPSIISSARTSTLSEARRPVLPSALG